MNLYLTLPVVLLVSSLTLCVAPAAARAPTAGAITCSTTTPTPPTESVPASHQPGIEPLKHGELAKWLPDDGASLDRFGFSVAVDGDTAIVGARGYGNHGAAYVFVRDGAGWTQQAKLMIEDGKEGDNFGFSVAVSGDTALVGAFQAKNKGKMTGAAYVFTRSGGVWEQQEKLVASDGKGLDLFGESVALSGDTALVGAMMAGEGKTGKAYVFARAAGTWSEQASLQAKDGMHADDFGVSVALSGDTAVVGADAVGAQGEASGAAYVFVRDGQSWAQQAKVTASDKSAYKFFGNPVALSGDTAVVGSYLSDGPAVSSGAAYVFVRDGATWTEKKKLTASDGAAGDGFGISVAISGGTVAIGAFDDNNEGAVSGSAYVFQRDCAGAWVEELKVAASDGASGDEFGYQVALSGGNLVVGASYHDDQGTDSGAAYFHSLSSPLETGQPCVDDASCISGSCLDGVCGCEGTQSSSSSAGGADAGAVAATTVGSSGGQGGAGGTGAGGAPATSSSSAAPSEPEDWCPAGTPNAGALCVIAAVGSGCAVPVGGAPDAPSARPWVTILALGLLARRRAVAC
jgi:MYXO-CTERM domain-containing protein